MSDSAPPTLSAPAVTWSDPAREAAFQAWLRDFTIRAIAAGWDAGLVTEQLAGLTVNPKVVELDTRQPEFVKSTGDYVRQSVTEGRVETGRRRRAEVPQFPDIEARYGVPSVSLSRGAHMDYHQLTDEAQYIDYPDYARLIQLVFDAATFVANADHRPQLSAPKPTDPHVPCRQ